MVLLFVVCGWREEAVAGVFLRTYLVHSTYVFLCTRATKVGKIVNPAVGGMQEAREKYEWQKILTITTYRTGIL